MKIKSLIKLNLMRATLTLALIVTCATAWAQNPNLAEYEFTTGQDASKWITLSDNATQIIASKQDDTNSDFTNIGFDFPFGDGTYSQFWTSSNGILSFNSEQEQNWNWQFTQNGSQANQPKICGISVDMSTGSNGYVKYEVTGTTPNRVLVCEFFLYGGGSGTDHAANIKWQVQLHEANAKVVMVYGDYLYTDLNSNQIGLSQSGSDIWTINVLTHEATHSTEPVESNNPVNIWPGANRYYEFNPPAPEDFTDNGDGTYTINTAAGWGMFCDAIAGGESFIGKTVKLGADITITSMASTGEPYFRGTFDGQGHTLTLDYGTASNPVDAQFVAPFVMTYWNTSPTFRNLTIDGHIYEAYTPTGTEAHNVGGLIGHLYGDVTIEHCTSNVEIINSSGGAGGFVGLCEHTVNFNDCMSSNVIHSAGGNNSGFVSWSRASGYEINFTGCVFNGKLLQIDGNGNSNGGFIGWTGSNKTVTITNCLYAPAALAEGEAYASYNSATFARGWNATTTATNSYYTIDFNDGTHYTGQGTQAYSITAGENVTVDYDGTPTNINATSGIATYATGIKYNNVLYAGENDQVSLTLNHSEAPTGYTFTGYTANAGTLNGTTLTMPNENVIISATMTANTYTVQFNGNGNTGGSMSDQNFTYGVAQNLTANAFTRTNYTFAGWNTQANGGGTSYTDGQEVSNLTATNNGTVTLYAQWTPAIVPVTYLDMNGTEQQCTNYTLLTSNMNNLGTGGQETWYVADGNVTFSNTINVANGNVHIILKDNAVMNVGTEQSLISEHGIYVYNYKSLNIYAQSTGADKGRLNVYATERGIEMYAASLTINGGEVTANGTNNYGIYAYSYSNITINGGQVTATGGSGIYANYYSTVTISGGQVTATGNNRGLWASQNSTLTISGGQVTATGNGNNSYGILSDHSTLTISGGQVTATGNGNNSCGILSSNGTLTISGGQVTANGNGDYSYGITTYYRAITLGWTNYSDFIYANSYHAYQSTINIAEGKTFITDDGTIYQSGELTSEELAAIAGKKLYPYVEGSVPYIDENGQRQLRLAGEYTTLTGNETTLGTAGQETWYVAQPGTLNYSSTIYLAGETHIILCDDAVMNVDVTSTNTSSGIYSASSGYSLSIYGQTNQSGELNVTSTDGNALYVSGDITIAGGKVTASGENGITADGGKMTIKNATVTATGTATTYNRGKGICSYNGGITIDNSNVTATGAGNNGEAIYSENGDIIIRNGGKTTANENNNVAILAAEGDITITGCEVEATGATGIFADNYDNNGDDGNVTIQNAMVTATTTSDGRVGAIRSNHGDITIDNSNVTATGTGNSGGAIFADNGDIIIRNGGKTTANANNVAIYAVVGDITITGCEVEATGNKGIYANNSDINGDDGNVTIQNATVTATTTSDGYVGAIHSYNGDITINNSNVTAMGTARYGIYAENSGNILLNGGKITANGSGFGLNCGAGNVTITGCEVEATGRIGIYANDSDNNGDDGNVTIQNATVTATGSYTAILSYNGDITIDNSNVEATSTGRYGIYAENSGNILLNGGKITANGMANGMGFGLICDAGSVTIESGQMEITGGNFGILASNITLGWTNATDYIYVSRYMDNENDPITLTMTFKDEASNTYSGAIAMENGTYPINGKTLYPQGVIFKEVAGYGEGSGGWVFIASPVAGSIAPTNVHNLVATPAEDFDLYYFDQTREKEWVNYKDNESHTNVDPGFNLVSGKGYLYATKYTKKLAFGGTFITNNEPVAVPLDYDADQPLAGWNLVGNPFTVAATMTDGQGLPKSYYVISGQTVVPYEGNAATIEPCTGVMVKAEGTGESVYFTKVSSNAAPQPNNGSLHIALSQVVEPVETPARDGNGLKVGPSTLRQAQGPTLLDNAIVSFNEGSQLGKFYFGEQNANLYLPQGAEEYAIVSVGNAGEMPVNFKAKENGTYTIAVNPKGVEMIYLHLIDNLTGADVDLLAAKVPELVEGPTQYDGVSTGSTTSYTFTAKTTDYESRFKLVFMANGASTGSASDETFAFISNGNLIVNGEGMLQIMDVTGRMIRCTDVARNVSTSGMVSGVYVLRLINGENVRTQKIVIE